jgi:hypothetical protein
MRFRFALACIGLSAFAACVHAAAPARAYPPSCFADGLPLGQAAKDPRAMSLPLTLHGDFNACFVNPAAPSYPVAQQECKYAEVVGVTISRMPCSGGKSATLFQLTRAAGMAGNTDLYPTFPGVWVEQSTHVDWIRLARDANTSATQVFVNSPVYDDSIYVLENPIGAAAFDYNRAFTLTVDNNTGRAVQFDLGDYDPADFPTAVPLPISGYQTGAWYDPAHGGEGMLVEILDDGNGTTRTLFATWFTFDALGAPYWLAAQASFPIGAARIDNAPVQTASGGGFAGNFTAVTRAPWGTMSFAFPDCSTMNFSYAASAFLPANSPAGSGTRTWRRLGSIANLGCS